MSKAYGNAIVEIVEQTQSKPMRFRYRSEGRGTGSIMGVKSTKEKKTYPAIRVLNYDGRVIVVVSCVTVDKTPKPHPNGLTGNSCKRGVCTVEFKTLAAKPEVFSFRKLGMECVKAKDVYDSLKQREEIRVDPFKTGFEHMHTPKLINLHEVRLCFQVFIYTDPTDPRKPIPLPPVLSDVISDKNQKNMELFIHNVSDQSSPACGGKKIMIFCDKVDKTDISIQFYEEDEQRSVVWTELVKLKPTNIHKQTAIVFTTPAYKTTDITRPVNVFFRLHTLSTESFGEPVSFQYLPDPNCIEWTINAKRRKLDDTISLRDYMQVHAAELLQKSKMICNIEPNGTVRNENNENITPDNCNCGTSNLLGATHNHLLSAQQRQHVNSFKPQSQHEQQFQRQQHPDYQWPSSQPQQKVDYQWPSSQPRQPMQIRNIESQQNQFQTMMQSQGQINHIDGIYSMCSAPPVAGATAVSNLNANHIADYREPLTQAMGNYPMPMIDYTCPIQPTLHSCQRVRPVMVQQFSDTIQHNQPIQRNVTQMPSVIDKSQNGERHFTLL